jgi:ABC-type uncharacterized transport system auxiliary subunit
MIKQVNILIALSLAFLISGCVSVKKLPPLKKYTIELSDSCCKKEYKADKKSIKILEPVANKSLHTNNILYSNGKYMIQDYTYNKWNDYPTKMLHKAITFKVDESNMYQNTISTNIKTKYDFLLQSELFEFKQVIEGQKSHTVLIIKFYLTDMSSNKTVSKIFKYKSDVDSMDAYGAVKSMNESSELLAADLLDWLNTNGDI